MVQFMWADDCCLKDILTLWKQGFPEDTEEDIRRFVDTFRREARCLLLFEDGEARSMAFLIPAQMDVHRVWYIYAAVTAKAYRGRGLFHRLLEEILDRAAQERVDGLFLRPGTASLFAYYSRLGFETVFSVEHFRCKVNKLDTEKETFAWQNITSNHALCREYWLSVCDVPHIVWSENTTEYAVSLLENGGMVASAKGMAIYHREKDELIVTELLCRTEDREEVLLSLARHFACRKIVVTAPTAEGEGQPYGMFRSITMEPLACKDWYMGFSLE